MIKLLPHWVLTDVNPAFYDVESKTAVEQTARVYAKMQEIIKDYNSFVDEVNKVIQEFSINEDYEKYKEYLTKIIHDYIAMLDVKIKMQDKRIEDSIVYIKNNLSLKITEEIAKMIETGELDTAVLNAVDNLGNRVDSLELSKTTIENTLNELSTKITSIESSSGEITRKISDLESSIGEVSNTQKTMNTKIEKLEKSSIEVVYDENLKEINLMVKGGE